MNKQITIEFDTTDRVWSIRYEDRLLVDISLKDERVFFNKALDICTGYFDEKAKEDMEVLYNIFHITLSIVTYYIGAANQSDYFDTQCWLIQEQLKDVDDWTDFSFKQLIIE